MKNKIRRASSRNRFLGLRTHFYSMRLEDLTFNAFAIFLIVLILRFDGFFPSDLPGFDSSSSLFQSNKEPIEGAIERRKFSETV